MINPQSTAYPREIIDYLNTHPAFHGSGVFDWHMWGEGFDGVINDLCFQHQQDYLRHQQDCFPFRFLNNIFGWTGKKEAFTKQDAREFLKWIEPYYCKYHKVETSGFFEKELPEVPRGILKLPEAI